MLIADALEAQVVGYFSKDYKLMDNSWGILDGSSEFDKILLKFSKYFLVM